MAEDAESHVHELEEPVLAVAARPRPRPRMIGGCADAMRVDDGQKLPGPIHCPEFESAPQLLMVQPQTPAHEVSHSLQNEEDGSEMNADRDRGVETGNGKFVMQELEDPGQAGMLEISVSRASLI